jgi:uncharacterized membrane protein
MDDSALAEEYSALDYEKSIKKNRLVYKPEGSLIFSTILDHILLVIIVGVGSVSLYKEITVAPSNLFAIIILSFAITWLISSVFLNNSLIKIRGKNLTDNRKDILTVMDKFFGSYNFIINNEKMMRSFKPSYSPIWGRIITILFDGDVIYLNITTLGKSDSPTMVHGLLNYIKAKRIARYYRLHYS